MYLPKVLLGLLLGFCLQGCNSDQENQGLVTIGINPWPGYEFLYLAEQKGFFKQVGANIKLVQLASLTDAQETYIEGHTDGMTSTLTEVVQAPFLGGKPLNVVLVTDYSNGGDVIIASKDIPDLTSLKGKTVGCEVSSLGIFILQRALKTVGLTLSDVTVVNVEQLDGVAAITSQAVDALVAYPPESVKVLNHPQFHTVFTSAEIPREIVDTLSISEVVLQQQPELVAKIHKAWQLALDFSLQYPEEANTIMASREGISVAEFEQTLQGVAIQDSSAQQVFFSDPSQLQQTATGVCETMVYVNSLDIDCARLPNLIYRGKTR